MIPPPPTTWPGLDGNALGCREKLKMLAENYAEVSQVLRDAFEDAILMGVDERRCAGCWRISSPAWIRRSEPPDEAALAGAPGVVVAAVAAGPALGAERADPGAILAAVAAAMAAGGSRRCSRSAARPLRCGRCGPDLGRCTRSAAGHRPAVSVQAGHRAANRSERPNIWVPATAAKLQALDKVNAQTAI